MQVRDKKSGEIETMRYGAAIDAINAGTHEAVSDATDVKAADEKSAADKGAEKKAEAKK